MVDTTKLKPKKAPEQLVELLKDKGVKFTIMSDSEAIAYLETKSNYFKLTAYRKNYSKQPQAGINQEQYIDLEFSYLCELASIDRDLRYLLMHMCADLEHAMKVDIIQKVTDNPNEDGYSIVRDFVSSNNGLISRDIDQSAKTPYCRSLYLKYDPEWPIWVFSEILPFGHLIDLRTFYYQKSDSKSANDMYYLLLTAKQLRNAVVHNNCIINDLNPVRFIDHTGRGLEARTVISEEVAKMPISKSVRNKRMLNARVIQFVTFLYIYRMIVQSESTRARRYEQMHNFFYKKLPLYASTLGKNELLVSTYNFLKTVVDNLCNQ